jgi:acyl-CoA thioester hydrolase
VTTSPDAFAFSYRIRVRWAEVDPQGIVFNAHYLMYFDVAATEYWRAIGCVYPAAFVDRGIDMFAVKSTLEYRSPARYDDELDLHVRVARLGRTSVQVMLDVRREADELVRGELVYVVANLADRRPTPIPDFLRSAILAFEKTPPSQA